MSGKIKWSMRIHIAVMSILILIPMVIVGPWFAFNELEYYLSYTNKFIYSSFTPFLIFLTIILGPILYLAVYSIITGIQAPLSHQKKTMFMMIIGCVLGLLFTVFFDTYFLYSLDKLGYEQCNGFPTGYMPGMGEQYVTDLALCD